MRWHFKNKPVNVLKMTTPIKNTGINNQLLVTLYQIKNPMSTTDENKMEMNAFTKRSVSRFTFCNMDKVSPLLLFSNS